MLVYIKKTIQISLILLTVFSIGCFVYAQGSVFDSMSSIDLNISPSNPRVGDSVVLTLSSDLLDLDSSKIVWYIDGVARKETSNKSVTIKTKSDGQKTTIKATVETSDGIIKETYGEIIPAGIDLIVEPMTYTLPFYKGKPFFVALSTLKIIAIPDVVINGVRIPSKDLVFKWTRENAVLSATSGKGRDSVVINSTIPVRDITIGVEILDESGNLLTETSKIITLSEPKILFYENSPLYGLLYNKAITGSYYLGTKEELKIVAKPFSFSFFNDTPEESTYSWYVNENYVSPSGKTNEVILRQTSTSLRGTASISLDLKNTTKINQYANGSFNVEFGE